MKKLITVALLLIFGITSYGQAKKAVKGYYFDKSGTKHSGNFVYKAQPTTLGGELIEYINGKKVKKQNLDVNNVKSFVLGTDSFFVAKNLTIGNSLSRSKVEKGFVKVIKVGYINLYSYKFEPQQGPKTDVCLIQVDGKSRIETINRSMSMKKEFEKVAAVMEGRKDLATKVEEIRVNRNMFDDLANIIEDYNTWKASN